MVLMLPAAGRVAVPWKNGGGQTTEIAVEPPASTFDTFDWRVSMAQVSTAGPFSLFPGIDRELAVLDGCLRLGIEGVGTCTLTPDSDPVRFAGDVRAHGEPLAGSVTDLNVMVRRGRCRARLERRQLPAPTALEPGPGTTLVLAVSALLLDADAQPFALEPLDAVRLEGVSRCTVGPRESGVGSPARTDFWLVTVSPIA